MSAADAAGRPALGRAARPQRVLMSADAVGGVWRYALDLATGLRALSRDQRTVIVLHHLAGLPIGEIAGELGIPSGTVKTRLHRGRAALARALAVHPEEVTHG